MLKYGNFRSHSGLVLPWKIELDDWTLEDWQSVARIVADKMAFSAVYGVPPGAKDSGLTLRVSGGLLFAEALAPFASNSVDDVFTGPPLIVDDVWTTGESMRECRDKLFPGQTTNVAGFVICARGELDPWVGALFHVDRMFWD